MGDSDKKQVGGTHYVDAKITPWSVIDTWPLEQRVGAYRAGALKYLMRMGSKDERLQEIRKAGHYCEKLAEVLGAVPVETAPEKPEPAFEKPWYCNRAVDSMKGRCAHETLGFCYEPEQPVELGPCVFRVDYRPGSKSPDLAKTQAAGLEQALRDQLATGTGVLKTTRVAPDEFTTAPQAIYGKCASPEPCLSQIGVLADLCGARGAALHCRHWRLVPITPPAGPEQAHGAESEGGEV